MNEQDKRKESAVNELISLSKQVSKIQAPETESKRLRDYLVKLGECLLGLGSNPDENINCFVAFLGEFMGATFALYNRLQGGLLCAVGQWHTPVNFKPADKPEGHICYDVIQQGCDEPFIVRDLENSSYGHTARSNVLPYKLKTYMGLAVKFDSTYRGSLCVVFQNDFVPSREEIKFMKIVASAIAVEENNRHTQLRLQETEERDNFICETVTDYVFTVRLKDGNTVETSHGPTCVAVTGYSPEEFAADPDLWIKIVHEQDQALVRQYAALVLSGKRVNPFEHRIVRKDGTPRWIKNTTVLHFDKEGRLFSYTGLIQDITERRGIEEELKRKREDLQIILDSIPALIFYKDKDNKLILVNKFLADAMCMKREEMEGKSCFDLWPKQQAEDFWRDDKVVMQSGMPKIGIIEPVMSPKGERWVQTDKIPYRDENGDIAGIIGFAIDITERKAAEDALKQNEEELESLNKELINSNKKLRQLSLRDPHTGLYNHRYLQDVIEAEFYRAKRYVHPFSLTMLDLDYFKSVNDAYGHVFGDLVLKQFARQLKRMVRQYDIVIRFGGEEFIIISPGIDRSGGLKLAQRLLDAIALYNFADTEHSVKLKLSVAVVSYPEDKIAKGMDLVEIADQIINKVKEHGGNNVYSSLDIKKKIPALTRKPSVDIGLLKDRIEKLTKRTNQSLIEAVFAFAKTIELKDQYTGEHVEKTVQYATEIARALNLPEEEIERIKQAAILHDLGKIGISEKILVKKSKLTKEEFEEIKKHPQIGVDIIRPIKFLHNIIPTMLYHHERWDGKGYPGGLKGEEIPIGARIVAISDVYQALISNRPYRKRFSKEEALKLIKNGSGTQFDPVVVAKFLQIINQKKEIL